MSDPIGKPGLLFLGSGYILGAVHKILLYVPTPIPGAAVIAWGGFVCTCIGGIYYLVKLYKEYLGPFLNSLKSKQSK